jgi:hypothetical protein
MSDDRRPQSPEAAAVFRLVAEGRLPPASGISATNDEPLWGLAAIAALLGLAVDDLLDHLRAAPPRFNQAGKSGGTGVYRLLAK